MAKFILLAGDDAHFINGAVITGGSTLGLQSVLGDVTVLATSRGM